MLRNSLIIRALVFSCFIFSIFNITTIQAQKRPTVIRGVVKDSLTKKKLPFANVFFPKSSIGVMANKKGRFKIVLKQEPPGDTVVVSQLGYAAQKFHIRRHRINIIKARLLPADSKIEEIVVKPGENPAHKILRNIIRNKEKNNPENFPEYSSETYTQLSVGISNIGQSKKSKSIIKRITKRLPGVIDSSGNKYLPLFVNEKLARTTVKQNPYSVSTVVKAKTVKGVGLADELEIDGYTTSMSTEANFYKNTITLFDKNFISPISSSGLSYYKYYIEDSIKKNGGTEVRIKFVPKNEKELVFKGEFKVMKKSWALTYIKVSLPKSANINFLNKFDILYEFEPINDSILFFKKNVINAAFHYIKLKDGKNKPLLQLKKTTIYNDVFFGKEVEQKDTATNVKDTLIIDKETANLLKKYQKQTYSKDEVNVGNMIDSINNVWWVKQFNKFANMFATGYYNVGIIDIGPYLELAKRNRVENMRFTILARTAENVSSRFTLAGKFGYGIRDKKYKYGGSFFWKFKTKKRHVIGLSYEHFMKTLGENNRIKLIKENMLSSSDDGFLISMFSRRLNEKIVMFDKASLIFENEWIRGFMTRLSFNGERIFSGEFIPFVKNNEIIPYIDNISTTIDFRFSFNEKTIDKYFRRYYLGGKKPIIHFLITGGQVRVGENTNKYLKLHTTLKHKFSLGIAMFKYIIEAGYAFGKIPYPLLEVHRGNETYGFLRYRFNLLNNMSLLSDKYVSLMGEYHANGILFNRIPLIKKLDLREVFSAKVLYGNLNRENNKQMQMPPFIGSIKNKEPYIEVGAGIENIFNLLRVEYVRRVFPKKMPNSVLHGIRVGVQVSF